MSTIQAKIRAEHKENLSRTSKSKWNLLSRYIDMFGEVLFIGVFLFLGLFCFINQFFTKTFTVTKTFYSLQLIFFAGLLFLSVRGHPTVIIYFGFLRG